MGDDAKAICPSIELVRVPELRGKADLTKYVKYGWGLFYHVMYLCNWIFIAMLKCKGTPGHILN